MVLKKETFISTNSSYLGLEGVEDLILPNVYYE